MEHHAILCFSKSTHVRTFHSAKFYLLECWYSGLQWWWLLTAHGRKDLIRCKEPNGAICWLHCTCNTSGRTIRNARYIGIELHKPCSAKQTWTIFECVLLYFARGEQVHAAHRSGLTIFCLDISFGIITIVFLGQFLEQRSSSIHQFSMGCLRTWQGATSCMESQIIFSQNFFFQLTDSNFFSQSRGNEIFLVWPNRTCHNLYHCLQYRYKLILSRIWQTCCTTLS